MRYYYEKPDKYEVTTGILYRCNHPVYTYCTLYRRGNVGLSVVQQRFNPKLKVSWWGAIDPWLIDDIGKNPLFESYFIEKSGKSEDGIFPTVNLRKIMWALKMKPLKKEPWEQELQAL